MNILPKKKWHVRTKENVARVRRDQKLAAEEEKRIKERAELGEQEFKVNLLRKNATERMESMYGVKKSAVDKVEEEAVVPTTSGGHVNFFADLEAEDRKNFGSGNREYEAEKRKEQEEYEKKIGILQFLGQGSKELTKDVPWYEQVRRHDPTLAANKPDLNQPKRAAGQVCSTIIQQQVSKVEKKRKASESDSDDDRRRSKHRKSKKSKKKKKKRRRSSSTSFSEPDDRAEKNAKLEQMRLLRIQREEAERIRTQDLLNPKRATDVPLKKSPKFHSQFNPELARQNLK